MTSDPLPEYDRPPVVESILGVQFEPLGSLKSAHLGVYWKSLGPEWSRVSDAPPLEPQFERFGASAAWGRLAFQLRLGQTPDVRLQIRNDASRMIQVQNGRFHFNWLGGAEYPRYPRVREEFDAALDHFRRFLAEEGLGEFRANQWEITYVNHIPRGTVWSSPRDWGFFRPLANTTGAAEGVPLESFGGEWHYEIAPQIGRLHIQWQHGQRSEPEGEDVVILTLTARGPARPTEEAGLSLSDGLDRGRDAIVRSFKALMSDEANRFWGLRHENAGNGHSIIPDGSNDLTGSP